MKPLLVLGWDMVNNSWQKTTISISIPASHKEALGDDVQVFQPFSVDKNFILTILYHRTRFYNIEKERLVLQKSTHLPPESVG